MRRSWSIFVVWALVLAAALNTGRPLLFNLLYLMTAAILLSFGWAWANLYQVGITRYTRARRSQVGKLAEEQFELRNLSFLPKLWLEVRDFSDLPGHRASQVVSSVGGHQVRRWMVRTPCLRRGRFTLGPMSLSSGDPLGLFRLDRNIPRTANLVVYPATVDLPAFAPPLGQLPGGDAMRQRTHHVTTNVSGIRDYVVGDSFNRIHWRSTARTGRLISKEFELDPTADVWVFVDMNAEVQAELPWLPPDDGFDPSIPAVLRLSKLGRNSNRADGTLPGRQFLVPSTEEYAVTIGASIAKYFLNHNRSVGLLAYGEEREVVQPERSERQLAKILETLAVIKAEGRFPVSHMIATDGEQLGRSTTMVVVTSDPNPQWVRVLRDMQRRGVIGMAVYIRAETFGADASSTQVETELIANGIVHYLINRDDNLEQVLSNPARARMGIARPLPPRGSIGSLGANGNGRPA